MERQPIVLDVPGHLRKDSPQVAWATCCSLTAIFLVHLVLGIPSHVTAAVGDGEGVHPSADAAPDGQVDGWEAVGKPRLVVQMGHSKPIARMFFSPDGKLLVTGDGDEDVLWETTTGREVRRWRKPETVVDFSPDGKQLLTRERTAATAWTLRIRDAGSGRVLAHFAGSAEDLTYAHFSADGKQLITLSDGRVRKEWDIKTGSVTRRVTLALAADKALAFRLRTLDGKVLVADRNADGTIQLFDEETGRQLRGLRGHSLPVFSLAASTDAKQLLSGSADTTARLWDVATGAEIRRFAGAEAWVERVAFGPDGKTVLTSNGETTRAWSIATGEQLRIVAGRFHGLLSGGKLVITGTREGVVSLWDLATGAEFRRLAGNPPGTSLLEVSPDGKRLLTAGADDTAARLWDIESASIVQRFEGYAAGINAVAFSADGKRIVTGGKDGTARLWDAATGREYRRLSGHGTRLTCVALSPDGKQVVTGSGEMLLSPESSLRLWDAASGKELRRLVVARTALTAVAFAPSGETVASAVSADEFVRLWNVRTGAEVRRFGPLHGFQEVTSVAFSPDGKWILAGTCSERRRAPTPARLPSTCGKSRPATPGRHTTGRRSVRTRSLSPPTGDGCWRASTTAALRSSTFIRARRCQDSPLITWVRGTDCGSLKIETTNWHGWTGERRSML
jgi:WD40 repeat protein